MSARELDWRSPYVVPSRLRFGLSPAGNLRVEHEGAADLPVEQVEVAGGQVELFLGFASAQTIEAAFEKAMASRDLDREVFGRLVESWIARGLLRQAETGSRSTSRLALFAEAMAEQVATASPAFPIRSHFTLQQPVLFFPGLETREIHDSRRFPWVAALEGSFGVIQAEFTALRASADFVSVNPGYTKRGEWAAAYLWAFGEKVEKICRWCPETTRLLTSIPGVSEFGTTMCSALALHSRIAPHHGITNAMLRCQLPLQVPPGCRLQVGDYEIEQQEGRCIVFDDSFLHSAWNDSDEARFVLLFDFFHPDLTSEEIGYLLRLPARQGLARHHLRQAVDGPKAAWARQGSLADTPG